LHAFADRVSSRLDAQDPRAASDGVSAKELLSSAPAVAGALTAGAAGFRTAYPVLSGFFGHKVGAIGTYVEHMRVRYAHIVSQATGAREEVIQTAARRQSARALLDDFGRQVPAFFEASRDSGRRMLSQLQAWAQSDEALHFSYEPTTGQDTPLTQRVRG
jgi:hypothetical protein